MAVENTPCLKDHLVYLAPFIGLGAAGGLIRELNMKKFSWKDMLCRFITGAFAGLLAGLYLKHTGYSFETQCAITGAVGATAPELLKAVQRWIIRKLGGEPGDCEDKPEGNTDDTATDMEADKKMAAADNSNHVADTAVDDDAGKAECSDSKETSTAGNDTDTSADGEGD